MNDPGLNSLLKWSVENSSGPQSDPTTTGDPKAVRDPAQGLSADALATLLGGPSDADRMNEAMAAIVSPEVDLENKLIAFDNFEQLVETIDNANNMEPLGLWSPMVQQLENEEPELRRMAAWCVGTAVQNNVKAQERLLVLGAIPTLVKLAREDPNEGVRGKAIYALSSEIRNYQPASDAASKALPEDLVGSKKLDAGDMEALDAVMEKLREQSKKNQPI